MLQVHATGDGQGDVFVADVDEPAAPGPRDVRLDLLAMTINPADLLQIEGRYGVRPPPPFTPGAEGVARIAEVGAEVEGLAPGDLAIPFASGCWSERMTTRASGVVKLPAGVDLDQAAMLKANPATALAMLSDIADLAPGDWIVQNAANSAVGVNVVKIARMLGLRTLNVVRREAAAARLRALGADAVIVGAEGLLDRAPEAFREAKAKLAFDAVGGQATDALAAVVADGGAVVNYGLLSGRRCEIDPDHLVFRDVSLRGFWLAQWFQTAGRDKIAAHYGRLVAWLSDGVIGAPVAAKYPLADIQDALTHAAKSGRDGKILLVTDAYEEVRRHA